MASLGPSWSRAEVEATVASYFRMLEFGLRGESFSKTEHRNALLPVLDHRTGGAVERKHQNISAILIEEKVPYISGYKPLGNYQQLLREVVLDELAARALTRQLIEVEVKRIPEVPSFDDILNVLTAPPAPRPGMNRPTRHSSRNVRASVDYLAMEAGNRALGLAGEKFVLQWEQARLEAAGWSSLAGRVSHVSVERGDGLGYDILSFEGDTRERLIEVKTTKFGEYTPFYVSENELTVSKQTADQYHLYRLYSFGVNARMFTLAGALNEKFNLSPSAYLARPA
jgi:Protein NO VEIN, C-terminal